MPTRRKKPSVADANPHLDEKPSGQLRDQVDRRDRADQLWGRGGCVAQGKLGTKNTLMPADANTVESAFAQRLVLLEEIELQARPGALMRD